MKQIELNIKSIRDSDINCTIIDSESNNPKLILLIHGFKADRSEGGRFLDLAKLLANDGINSIMMSFAGCQGSDEDFINYTLTNNLNDIETCYKYMLDNYNIDTKHIGIVGYSMGGRLASIFVDKHKEVNSLVLWAGYCTQGFGGDYFLGCKVSEMLNEASVKGYCNFYNAFDGETLKMNKQLLDDIVDYDIYDCLSNYEGNAFVVHGDKDITVDLNIGLKAYELLERTSYKDILIIKDADHGFGLWDNHMEQSEELVTNTYEFIKKYT